MDNIIDNESNLNNILPSNSGFTATVMHISAFPMVILWKVFLSKSTVKYDSATMLNN
ncbi:hypothetical protein FJMB80151_12510 [Enterobacter hormaechei]|nr:hypothetical protein [Enterobacter hormaechei]BDK24594.1 hypothetical protein FJMB80063_12730 [Enterobacter hormaechei]BDK29709.1 hypothetical protein FJMB80068_12730 [Enterobacter hormaechei]BDK34741.1 hypothetical protein FJMB80144_12520 [Enterobacter hormaechei]BDK39938.1 hypothetical protein FJMB80145_12510 [Enterobacter hormaechei]BDK45143.1 hypothetical protein FJMB80146_12520 [Enterobacter hormaechei]